MKKFRVRTVVLSDIHLGTVDSKVAEVNHFLRHVRCEKLILNGDIIDAWQLKRSGRWTKTDTHFIRVVLKMLEKRDTQIVYLRGNHDDILSKFLPLEFENLLIADEYVHEGVKGRYLVLHGDVFDTVTTNFVFLAHLGDWGYQTLLGINRAYNIWRSWRGLDYWSLSRAIKARVKSAVSHVSKFEEHITELARSRLHGRHVRPHPHARGQGARRNPLPQLGRLDRVDDGHRRALGRPLRARRVLGLPAGVPGRRRRSVRRPGRARLGGARGGNRDEARGRPKRIALCLTMG